MTVIQRHGSAANLNVHLHMLVLDGVHEPVGERVRFRSVAAPSEEQLQALLTGLVARIVRRLTIDGWISQDTDPPSLELQPRDVIDELAAASIRHRIAAGPEAGRRTLTLRSPSLGRLAAPVPRPRVHLTRYHGVFAPQLPTACSGGAVTLRYNHPQAQAVQGGGRPRHPARCR